MPQAVIFDVDGTLLDSVDLHAIAWQDALARFGHDVSFREVRSQIGKGGDKLIPLFLSREAQEDHAKELEAWRSERFKAKYLPLIRPFSAVPELLRHARDRGLQIAIASSAKKDELETYLDIAGIAKLVDETVSAEDVDASKPDPDVFQAVMDKLQVSPAEAVAVGDTPYDAEAAGKAGITTIGVLCGGFTEDDLRTGGCTEVYPGPAALLVRFDHSALA